MAASSRHRSDAVLALFVVAIVAMLLVPLPTYVLDLLLAGNISFALLLLLVGLYMPNALAMLSFPSLLLLSTLFRLGLNVASTRLILSDGDAGSVIEAFGTFLIRGEIIVGGIIFITITIVNFIVIAKGASRVSEVAARFALDALPGKQMAIDADLNAGIIDQDEAKRRREDVAQEADFYGSMDGASKFVKGDAVAGILILIINIVGGLTIGMAQHGLGFGEALENYTLLTIGDGLVAQIPSLLLSTAAAIIVTRVNSEQDMGQQVMNQMFAQPKALGVAAGILFTLGIVPGMPHFVFISLAAAAAASAWMIHRRSQQPELEAEEEPAVEAETQEGEDVDVSWDDVTPVDTLGLEVGYKLIPMVDKAQGGELISRVRGVRKKLSQELGFLVPTIHIRDNLDLLPTMYRFSLVGVNVAEGEVHADKLLAIDPGEVFGQIQGLATTDSVFGLFVVWIDEYEKDNAQTLGYTVVDASTVVATHINQVMLENAADLLGHDEVQHLLDLLGESSPKLAEQLVPNAISLSGLLKILQSLLREKIPIRDIRTIAECLADGVAQNLPIEDQTSLVRSQLGRMIVQNIYGNESAIEVITLDPELEQLLLQAKNQGGAEAPVIEPSMAERLQQSVVEVAQEREVLGKPAVLLVSAGIRALLARFVRMSQSVIHVLAYEEIPESKQITVVSTIGRSA